MKNKTINLGVIKKIAHALGDLNKNVVYVGGAVVSLYINDPAADDVRPTKDIDITMEIASLSMLEQFRQELIAKGFQQSAEDQVMCRFRYDDIKVDVMSTKAIDWAPANPWFAPGFKHLKVIEIEETTIQILSLPYYLATKYTAFKNRGEKDPRTSHDFEDIAYILDNQTDLVSIIDEAPQDVRTYLHAAIKDILNRPEMQEAILGNLYHETQTKRFEMIITKLKQIIARA